MTKIYMASGNVIEFDGEVSTVVSQNKVVGYSFTTTGHDSVTFLDQTRVEAIIKTEEWA